MILINNGIKHVESDDGADGGLAYNRIPLSFYIEIELYGGSKD
jgi:hypothetical protein